MEDIIIDLVLPLIEQLLPMFGTGTATTATIDLVIKGLQTIIPMTGSLGASIVPKIKNIIAVVSGDPAATATQLAALQQLDAASDAAFDAAADAAALEDVKPVA